MPTFRNLFSRSLTLAPRNQRRLARWIIGSMIGLVVFFIVYIGWQVSLRTADAPSAIYCGAQSQLAGFDVSPCSRELLILSGTYHLQGQAWFGFCVETMAVDPVQKSEIVFEWHHSRSSSGWHLEDPVIEYTQGWFLRDRTKIVLMNDKSIRVLDRTTKTEQYRLNLPPSLNYNYAVSPDGNRIAAWRQWEIQLWDIEAKSGPFVWAVPSIDALCFTGDSQRLVALVHRGCCEVWNLDGSRDGESMAINEDSEIEWPPVAFSETDPQLCCSKRGDLLAYSEFAGIVEIWDMNSRKRIAEFRAHEHLNQFCFMADGTRLITAGSREVRRPAFSNQFPYFRLESQFRNELKLWDVKSGKCLRQWPSEAIVTDLKAIQETSDFVAKMEFEGLFRFETK